MNFNKLILFLSCIVLITQFSFAQNEQATYLSAKQYFSTGRYDLAMELFKQLSNPSATHDFVKYALFYYGLAAYKNNNLELARSIWLQVEKKFPKWNKIEDVYFWLAQVYFEEGNHSKGIQFIKKSNTVQEKGLIYQYVSKISKINKIDTLNQQYPDDKTIAMILVNAIINQPINKRNFIKLEQLSTKFNLDKSVLGLPDIGKSIKKSSYNVAILLPFMFDGLDNISRVSRNKFVLDIYQGILEAVDTLNFDKKWINIFPYDTKRNGNVTVSILQKEEMKNMDLFIGPLFPIPSKTVSNFCLKNKINMINPISSNNRVINNNPYSFLFKPNNETKALRMAEYAANTFTHKNAFIFYDETDKDSISAYIYKEKIEKEGFNVLQCLKIDDKKIAKVHELLTHTYKVALSIKQKDSIMLIDSSLVKFRTPKPEDLKKLKKLENNEEYEDSIFYYQKKFTIAHDSIGHIFVSSSKPLHASSFISAIEIRSYVIPLLTNAPWMNFEMLTTSQLERLKIKFIDSNYINFNKESYKKISKIFEKKLKKHPTLNNCIGYEVMYYTGQMMQRYGSYFQKETMQLGVVEGQIFEGFYYGTFNSNQYVPILTFENAELINISKK